MKLLPQRFRHLQKPRRPKKNEAAAKDGVSDLNVMEQNYATGVYEETAFKYAITISSSGTQVAAFDITEIVNDWFKG